jgi:hypothetical protein
MATNVTAQLVLKVTSVSIYVIQHILDIIVAPGATAMIEAFAIELMEVVNVTLATQESTVNQSVLLACMALTVPKYVFVNVAHTVIMSLDPAHVPVDFKVLSVTFHAMGQHGESTA